VTFGLWGNHVLRWKQATFRQHHCFRFEEIIAEPDSFADKLSAIIGKPRSREPFPKFSEFKAADPNFFGSGKAGAHLTELTDTDVAVFNLYNGPAMNLAGYGSEKLEPNEHAAYLTFCAIVEHDHQLAKKNTELAAENAQLRKENERLERRHNNLKKYTGVEYLSKALKKVKALDNWVRN
jgi:hypothetical protein